MPPVDSRSNYQRLVLAVKECNFITMEGIQCNRSSKDGTKITLWFADDSGEEFCSAFDETTSITLLDNKALFVDKAGVEVTINFFQQSKYFI